MSAPSVARSRQRCLLSSSAWGRTCATRGGARDEWMIESFITSTPCVRPHHLTLFKLTKRCHVALTRAGPVALTRAGPLRMVRGFTGGHRMSQHSLQQPIEELCERRDTLSSAGGGEAKQAVEAALELLDSGAQRVAEPTGAGWQVNQW